MEASFLATCNLKCKIIIIPKIAKRKRSKGFKSIAVALSGIEY